MCDGEDPLLRGEERNRKCMNIFFLSSTEMGSCPEGSKKITSLMTSKVVLKKCHPFTSPTRLHFFETKKKGNAQQD